MSALGPAALVVDGGRIGLQKCTLYAHDGAGFPVVESHHVVPESWWRRAGLPVSSPLRTLCPNCHTATHAAIDGLLRGLDVSALPPRCHALAADGIAQGRAAGLAPAPTL